MTLAAAFSAVASAIGGVVGEVIGLHAHAHRPAAGAAEALAAYFILVHRRDRQGDGLAQGRFSAAWPTTPPGSFDGIRDALAAGDITLAAKVLWAMLKLEWQKGQRFSSKRSGRVLRATSATR